MPNLLAPKHIEKEDVWVCHCRILSVCSVWHSYNLLEQAGQQYSRGGRQKRRPTPNLLAPKHIEKEDV